MSQDTVYVKTKVQLLDNISIYIDGNSKITFSNGTFDSPKPNAFSLPHIVCCPNATPTCKKSCYVHDLKVYAPEIYKEYTNNKTILDQILSDENLVQKTAVALGTWISENCKGGFRWHVSGDITCKEHARWINLVCLFSSNVQHFIYTRTFDTVRLLMADNLHVHLSADKDNFVEAMNCKRLNTNVYTQMCYLAQDNNIPELPDKSIIFPDYVCRGRDLNDPLTSPWWKNLTQNQKKMTCPADFFGQSDKHRCGVCKKCYVAKG